MSKPVVKFCFDAISPYAWLAWRPLNDIVARHDVTLRPVPVLFAGILNANGQLGPAEIPRKRLWLIKDVMRRAESQKIGLCVPPKHPFNPLLSLRVASLDMDNTSRQKLTGAMLEAVWLHGRDISDAAVVADVASSVGLDGNMCVREATENEEVKNRLKNQTAAAVASGAFGVPTTFVNDELFWGSEIDTMNHIEAAVQGIDTVNHVMYNYWRDTVQAGAVRKGKST